jgi:hypothetical protein
MFETCIFQQILITKIFNNMVFFFVIFGDLVVVMIDGLKLSNNSKSDVKLEIVKPLELSIITINNYQT